MSAEASPAKSWVQFEDEGDGSNSGNKPNGRPQSSSSGVSSARGSVRSAVVTTPPEPDAPGALDVSEVQVVDESTIRRKVSNAPAGGAVSNAAVAGASSLNVSASSTSSRMSMDNVNLSESAISIEPNHVNRLKDKTFSNGEVVVTLLPVNERFPWVTPAKFRPELVPEELMAPCLTLTVEEYVMTMEKLTTDMRFSIFNILYKRILIVWIATAFVILMGILFSGYQKVDLFICGVVWLVLNAAAIFGCMWIKLKLNKQLEKCMAVVNSSLVKHKLILGLDDRGKLSCHKANLCWIYFDPTECIKKLESVLEEKPEESQQNGAATFDREAYLRDVEDFDDVEIVVSGRGGVPVGGPKNKRERAEKLYLHYIQRWAKDYLRRRLDWMMEDLYGNTEYTSNCNPRHLRTALCPCQYIEEHLRNKRHRESVLPCSAKSANPCHWCV